MIWKQVVVIGTMTVVQYHSVKEPESDSIKFSISAMILYWKIERHYDIVGSITLLWHMWETVMVP